MKLPVLVFLAAFIGSQCAPLLDNLHGQIVLLERQYDHLLKRDANDENKLDHFMKFHLRNAENEILSLTLAKNTKLSRNLPLTIVNDEGEHDTDIDTILSEMGAKRSIVGGKSFHERNVFYHEPNRKGVFGLADDGHRITMRGTFFDKKQLYEVEPLNGHPTHAHIIKRSKIPRHFDFGLIDDLDFDVIRSADGDTFDTPPSGNQTSRDRRAMFAIDKYKVSNALNVELLIATDAEFYRQIKSKLSENTDAAALEATYFRLNYIMNGMDIAYAEIADYPFDIWCKKLIISTTDAATPWTGADYKKDKSASSKDLNAELSLTAVGNWAAVTKGWAWNLYDHVMTITGYNLGRIKDGNWDSGVVGLAPFRGVCFSQKQVSINQDTGFNTWTTCAHELAHNLGAGHDGDSSDPNPECKAEKHYLMTPMVATPSVATLDNVVKFSPCSKKEMKNNCLGKITPQFPKVCLFNAVCKNEESKITWATKISELPGQRWDINKQCEITVGAGYKFYEGNGGATEWPEMCRQMQCFKDSLVVTPTTGATDGTFCNKAKTKWCIHHKCIDKTDDIPLKGGQKQAVTDADFKCDATPSIPSGCTDTTTTKFKYDQDNISTGTGAEFTLTCPDMVPKAPFTVCTNSDLYGLCCKTCRSSYFIVDSTSEGTGSTGGTGGTGGTGDTGGTGSTGGNGGTSSWYPEGYKHLK